MIRLHYATLKVSDTGTGMDEETAQRIFEPFFTTKGEGKGTGLGLSIAQGIVAQSGGYIEVESEKEQGTIFTIYLPALAAQAAELVPLFEVLAEPGKETILVVEDEAEVRKYAAAALKEYGYNVIQAASAGEALLKCEMAEAPFDLVLTDVVKPNLDGQELVARLRKLQPGIKVLFMSGYAGDVMAQRGVQEPGAQFIQKPFSSVQLAAKVRSALGPAD